MFLIMSNRFVGTIDGAAVLRAKEQLLSVNSIASV
jgi:hypothetical protein